MTDQTVVQPPAAQPAAEPPRRSLSQIASDVLGSDFKGEVKPVETEEPKPSDAKDGEAPVEEPTEGETEIVEPEEGEEETAPEDDTGEMPIATVSELVEHLEANPEWFDGLKMSFNVDGMPTEATIKELVDSYQLRGAAEHRFETAKQIAQKESETWAAKHRELDGQFQILAEMIKGADAQLERDIQAVDPKLRGEDPAEWAARIQEFQERRAAIAQMKVGTVERYKALQAQQTEEAKAMRDRFVGEQAEILVQKLPEWRDPQVADAEKLRLQDYLLYKVGIAPQELENLIDHRQILIARKAMLYDESRGQVDTAKKRVAKVPKMMKSGAPKPREQLASEKLQALKAKMENTGTLEDALAYRMAKRGVSR